MIVDDDLDAVFLCLLANRLEPEAQHADIIVIILLSQLERLGIVCILLTAGQAGDLLRDGYWSNTAYAPGQEELLYLEAAEVMAALSKPSVTYTVTA